MAKLNWHKSEWPCKESLGGDCSELIGQEKPGWNETLYFKHVGTHGVVILSSYHRTLLGVFKTEEEADQAVLDTIRKKIAGLKAAINEE